MNTRSDINWINQELLKSSDPSVIQQIKDFLLTVKNNESYSPVSLEKYNEELESGIQEVINGNSTTDEVLGKEIASW